MSNGHCSSPSLIPRPVAVNSVRENEIPDASSNTENLEASAEHIPQDAAEDGVVDEYEKLALSLRDCDWEQLQKEFADAMDERSQVEMALHKETAELLEMFTAWSQTTAYRDEDRAYKRFKTRMGFAQTSETKLEEKKKHCMAIAAG
ncbi:hypothetical protein I7I50_05128 [Histoplasma capsulatum G186AR]|uniref:Uncharacterized protein n=1 Tax=Ajellomyces capsulatus TaxID=5037 RepID=A0A8H8D9T1_AJECA|nr:hypothetical protein I7I52_03386 [Histoplasma capsulatum]QSS75852.1 hypothetical protein I7I50_05128 [Histoplasma capsulatum G186AR]